MQRKGLLLAISSLPGKYGIGDFGCESFEFIDILAKHNYKVWQILSLNPIGYGHSPYQPFSSYAFDEIYISIEDLQTRGLLDNIDTISKTNKTNFEEARKIKENAIYLAFKKYSECKANIRKILTFLKDNKFIDEFVKFITLKEFNNSKCWNEWTVIKTNKNKDYKFNYLKHAFAQMILFEEWKRIRKYANKKGVKILGDVPFYVGYDSSDLYFHKNSFYLDEKYNPTCIAGVPPDYFSKDGQRWGNPIYDWNKLENTNFKMLVERIGFASNFFDIIRIDHFRAFDSYWSINPECQTATDGKWIYPNGYGFFNALFKKYPKINIVAEDLGELREEVLVLRDHFNLPGMRVAQFTIFDDEILGKKIEKRNMLYCTSTHDNETLKQWCDNLSNENRNLLFNKLEESNIPGDLLQDKIIRYALKRKENFIIINVTDLLNLDADSRMNKPGVIDNENWTFKLKDLNIIDEALNELR